MTCIFIAIIIYLYLVGYWYVVMALKREKEFDNCLIEYLAVATWPIIPVAVILFAVERKMKESKNEP